LRWLKLPSFYYISSSIGSYITSTNINLEFIETKEPWWPWSYGMCTCILAKQVMFQQTWHANINTGSKTLNYRLFKNKFEFENYFNILDDRDIFTFITIFKVFFFLYKSFFFHWNSHILIDNGTHLQDLLCCINCKFWVP
jgi:hypothetical protein